MFRSSSFVSSRTERAQGDPVEVSRRERTLWRRKLVQTAELASLRQGLTPEKVALNDSRLVSPSV